MKRYVTPATVIAGGALFVALGGTSLAGNRAAYGHGISVIQIGGGHAGASFMAGSPGTLQKADVQCGAGAPTASKPKVVGGGFTVDGGNASQFVLTGSYPVEEPSPTNPTPDKWQVEGYYRDPKAGDPPLVLTLFAKCIGWIPIP